MELMYWWVGAGLKEYDPDGVEARAIEAAIEGVHVMRHGKCCPLTLEGKIQSSLVLSSCFCVPRNLQI